MLHAIVQRRTAKRRTRGALSWLGALAALPALAGAGCGGEDATLVNGATLAEGAALEPAPAAAASESPSEETPPADTPVYVTSTLVLSDDGQTTYVTMLPSLEVQRVELGQAREFPGWAGIWAHEGKLFISDGESPIITRFTVAEGGQLRDEGRLSFFNQGAAFADSAFVAADKAYVFAEEGVVWDTRALEITGGFELPLIDDRAGGLEFGGITTGRSLAVSGNRTFVATNWANWDEYTVSEDSLIAVIDSDENRVIDMLEAPCPYLDVASVDDDGNVYFSNWVYSLGQTLLDGKQQACAVRIRAGEDRLDPDWSLTFADVTGGREAAALRYVGDGKAVISVFHHEMADLSGATDPATLANAANWRFWMLDLDTLAASALDDIGFHAGGFSTSRVDGRTFLLMPSADYESTSVYELATDGTAEPRWTTRGWSMELIRVR